MEMNISSSTSTLFQNQTQQQQNIGLKRLSHLLPIAIAITLTNGLVFVLFYKRKTLRIACNYLLFGLAICDFLTGAINIPYFIMFSFAVMPHHSFFWMYVLHSLVAISAAYHILMITAVKYLAIIRPLRHHLVTKNTVIKVLVVIWITASLIAVMPLAWRKSQSGLVWYIVHGAVCLMIVFLVPYVFMLYAYIVMFKVISRRKRPSSVNVLARLNKNSNDRKCVVVFATMAAIFVSCWLPYFILMLTTSIKRYMKEQDTASINKTFEAFGIIRYITSFINPLLYTFFKRDFWCALRNLFFKTEFNLRPITARTRPSKSCHFTSQFSSVDDETKLSALPWNKERRSNVAHSEVPMNYISSV